MRFVRRFAGGKVFDIGHRLFYTEQYKRKEPTA